MKGKFDWRAAYFNLVSLVAIITFLIAAIGAGHGVLRIAFPKLSMDQSEWTQTESFESYKRWRGNIGPRPRKLAVPTEEVDRTENSIPDSELRTEWEEYRRLAVEGERRRGLWNLMEGLVTVFVAIPIFWWHRRGAKKLRPENDRIVET